MRLCKLFIVLLVLTLLAFLPSFAFSDDDSAGDLNKGDSKKYFTFAFENNSIGSGQDQNYTNGIRATYFDNARKVPAFA